MFTLKTPSKDMEQKHEAADGGSLGSLSDKGKSGGVKDQGVNQGLVFLSRDPSCGQIALGMETLSDSISGVKDSGCALFRRLHLAVMWFLNLCQ